MMDNYIPNRGDVVWINMNPQAGLNRLENALP